MNCPTRNPLQWDGTSQYQRMLEALKPSTAPIHEYTLREWMKFAFYYAQKLNYYNINDDKIPHGDWRNFVPADDEEIEEFLKSITGRDADAAIEPHLALFVSFIKLLKGPKHKLNQFTRRHLDFYYAKVLQLKKRPATEDKVHLVFELVKNIASYKLDDDTLFDAGKDKTNKPLEYMIDDEPVFTRAKVELLKSVYHQKGNSVRFAEVANSADGSGAALKKEDPLWYAFGFGDAVDKTGNKIEAKLPPARLGFALASSILLLKEGERVITITLNMVKSSSIDFDVFNTLRQMTVMLTGEKDWIDAGTPVITHNASRGELTIEVRLGNAEKAIIGYDAKLHKENYITDLPVIRFLLETEKAKNYKAWYLLSKAVINKAVIKVEVKGMKSLVIENDDGRLDPSKPFLPFGAMPRVGSGFYIGSDEIFQKRWDTITVNIDEWKSKPADLADQYFAYRKEFISDKFSRAKYDLLLDQNGNINPPSATTIVVTDDEYFKADIAISKNGAWQMVRMENSTVPRSVSLFTDEPLTIESETAGSPLPKKINFFAPLLKTGYSKDKSKLQQYIIGSPVKPIIDLSQFKPGRKPVGTSLVNSNDAVKDNFIRIRLLTDFFHHHFPVLYAAAMTRPQALIPKEPYTPVIASITIGYTATIENTFSIADTSAENKLKNYTEQDIQLFHETPFGQSEQHIFLKEQQEFVKDKRSLSVLPQYEREGELYIGIKNAEPQTMIRILFQVAEGSENPASPAFDKDHFIEWYGLCNNEWKPMNGDFIIADDTNNFLRPGIIQFLLPAECTVTNTILPKDHIWLKAVLPEGFSFDTVCKFIDVIAQASIAVFTNNNNDLSHLTTALPAGTISKMINRQSAVKTVAQPFNSFEGLPAETDEHFYIRVSERLRHKNRAVNIWDYERLVLEKFPSIYKVKCLNHTSSDFELSPGCVRIIPVPDTRNKNMFDMFQPRVSRNVLSRIQDFLSELHGFHIDCKAENPGYEPVQLDFAVQFFKQYDPRTYARILENEIKKYLSPWAYDDFAGINFGGELIKSKVIAFIEDRIYVDYIADFKMYKEADGNDSDKITAGDSRSILTSAKKHFININPPVCKTAS